MNILDTFKTTIQEATRILITTHEYPDADGIGSEISLCLALRQFGKDCFCVNEEPLLERYKYLDQDDVVLGLEEFIHSYGRDYQPDLIIVVDTNTKTRVGNKFCQFIEDHQKKEKTQLLYIDHHPTKEKIGPFHCVDTTAAATGQIVGEFIEGLSIPFTQKIALPLYTAIIIDTSSFRYPTVSSNTHRLVSKLMETGIKPPKAYNGIYGTKKIQHMHLLSKILSSAAINKDETIAWIILKQQDLKDFDGDIEDTHAFINNLLVLDHIKVACMFRDDGDVIKLSLRSTGTDDVGLIATSLGGGGHSHSAAALFKKDENMKLEQLIPEIISQVEKALVEISRI